MILVHNKCDVEVQRPPADVVGKLRRGVLAQMSTSSYAHCSMLP
ncbi:hypothetical protein AVEN_89417-1, partial [Araneus ventricosus]